MHWSLTFTNIPGRGHHDSESDTDSEEDTFKSVV